MSQHPFLKQPQLRLHETMINSNLIQYKDVKRVLDKILKKYAVFKIIFMIILKYMLDEFYRYLQHSDICMLSVSVEFDWNNFSVQKVQPYKVGKFWSLQLSVAVQNEYLL